MPRLAMTVPHRLGRNQNILSIAFKAMGMSVAGTITVEDTEVRLVAQVPFAALIFKRLIEKTVRAELRGLLT